MDKKNAIYISKPLTFKYTFTIGNSNEEFGFGQIREELRYSLMKREKEYDNLHYEYEKNDNVIYSVINDRLQKHFSFAGNTKAYLTDYSENRGSLLISFSVLIFGAITNYGSIRDSIDYFAEDIERLFYRSLKHRDKGYTVASKIQEINNQKDILLQHSQTSETNQYDLLLSKIKINRIFIGIISFVLILLLVLFLNNISVQDFSNTNTPKQDKINELIIRKIVEDEIRNQKIDDLLNNVSTNKIEKVE